MMKAAMRLQKNQLPSMVKLTATGTFRKNAWIMAGYTNFQMLLVGAGGGRSGTHSYGAIYRSYGSGGGGGESKIVSGSLITNMQTTVNYVIGQPGSQGADSTSGSGKAGDGGFGGATNFGIHTAYGGDGGLGGGFDLGSYVTGSGGNGMFTDGSIGQGGYFANPPTNGEWNPGTLVGIGGGGGAGFQRDVDTSLAQAGASGTVHAAGYTSAGGAVVSNIGGHGGGCNIAPFTGGAAEYYGSLRPGSIGSGVIVIKFT